MKNCKISKCNNKMQKSLNHIKRCDVCGEIIEGKSYKVINENYITQKGLEQCELCYGIKIK